ncbi:MAG: tripartite tricarboxylate transporter substrate binding protein [Burkholderiales bacterium]|nr:tripartite tricarboxylate transporter substrate binding protein [Burkholderiales bacterium]
MIGLAAAATAHAQGAASYPSKPVKVIVPFTAGGPADSVTRFIAQRMSEAWGQPVVVENRVGAGGMIGAEAIAKSAPDGYTFGLLVTGHTIHPAMQEKMPYDITRDFTPISIVNRAPKLVVVNPSVPASNLKELIQLMKSDPTRYAPYGTSGVGSMAHLSMELVNTLADTRFVHVPYKGGAATLSDLMGGQLPFAVLDLGSVLPQVRSGKLKVLAITARTRSAVLPEVPTISETLPAFEATEWFGLAGPAGIPADITLKIQRGVKAALESPEAKARYIDGLGWELVASTPDEMKAMIETQTRDWANLARRIGLKAQ